MRRESLQDLLEREKLNLEFLRTHPECFPSWKSFIIMNRYSNVIAAASLVYMGVTLETGTAFEQNTLGSTAAVMTLVALRMKYNSLHAYVKTYHLLSVIHTHGKRYDVLGRVAERVKGGCAVIGIKRALKDYFQDEKRADAVYDEYISPVVERNKGASV